HGRVAEINGQRATYLRYLDRNIGLRAEAAPEVRYSALIPATAAIITIGIRRASGFTGTGAGRSGGFSTTIRPPGMTGGRVGVVPRASIKE
ncbi:MAG: hypothetical protein U1D00_23555, partial [Mycobacterium sp.]|nr:hypothetical protein [Mycobacterium sp.]